MTPSPSPESLEKAKKCIKWTLTSDSEGYHGKIDKEETIRTAALALDAARLEAKLEEREACADMLWPIPLGTKYSGTIEGVLEDLSTDIRNRGK